jgi:hypothetical protein
MANILGLAMKISADATGVQQSLKPAERALISLSAQAEKATAVFEPFAEKTAAAARAQDQFADRIALLTRQLQQDIVKPQEFAKAFEQIAEEAKATADAFEEGAEIQRRYGEQTKIAADEVERLLELEQLGAISTDALNRAAIEKLGINRQAAQSAKERADAVAAAERQQQAAAEDAARAEERIARERAAFEAEAQRIREASFNAQQRAQANFDRAIERARLLEQQGFLTKQEFNTELERQAGIFAKVVVEAGKAGDAIEQAAAPGELKFRELAGTLAILPGPLGNIAGRMSGIASASEGLSRVFSNGLVPGAASVGRAITSLINPFTLSAAAVAGFAAAASSIANGLIQLKDRVQTLGNTADRLGVSFEFIQTLDDAARRSGTSLDAVASAFGRLQRNVLGVDEESKSAQKALTALGIAAEELQAKRPEEQYLLVGQRLAAIPDPARRSATAINLLGRAGAELLPFFNSIGGAAADMERFGATLATSQRRDIDAFSAAMDRLGTASKGAGDQLYASFAPAGEAIANSLAEATGAITDFLNQQNRATSFSRELQKLRSEYTGVVTDSMIAAIRDGRTAEEVLAVATGAAKEFKDTLEDPPSAEFTKTLDEISKKVEEAKLQSVEFGQAGFDAAVRFEQGIADLKTQLDRGLFNEETFRQQADRVATAFKTEIGRISEDSKLDIQIESDAQKTLGDLNRSIDAAIKGSREFGQAGFDAALRFQNKLRDLGEQFQDRRINQTTLSDEVERATATYDKQIQLIKLIGEELTAVTETEKQIQVVLAGRTELERQIADARQRNDVAAAKNAENRLAESERLLSRLQDQQQAIDQGFSEGFDRAFEQQSAALDDALRRTKELGAAGVQAAQTLANGFTAAQRQTRDGIFNKAAFDADIRRVQGIFEEQVKRIEELKAREQQAQQQRFQVAIAANERINQFLKANLEARTKAEIDAIDAKRAREITAAENVAAIKERIAVTEKSIAAAREAGDLKAARARQAELDLLKKAQIQQQKIADGRDAANVRQNQQLQSGFTQAQQFQSLVAKQNDTFLKSFTNAYAGANASLEAANAAAAEILRQQEMMRPVAGPVNTADIRTQEGQNLVLSLAANAQDPALIEARQQTKQLQIIAQGISQAASNYFNTPVAIVGGAVLG